MSVMQIKSDIGTGQGRELASLRAVMFEGGSGCLKMCSWLKAELLGCISATKLCSMPSLSGYESCYAELYGLRYEVFKL